MASAHNALVGLRPTVGLVSRNGMVPLNSIRDTAGPIARSVTDMAVLLDAIVGADPEDPATERAAGHIPPTYTKSLKKDGLKGARLGVLRQLFKPAVTDPRIIVNFSKTLDELKGAGAEIIDPFIVATIDSIPQPPLIPRARIKDDLTKWINKHAGVPFPSVRAISESKLLHPLHQCLR
jgi:amidase